MRWQSLSLILFLVACSDGDSSADSADACDSAADTGEDTDDPVIDLDGDGYPAEDDCNDQNADVYPGAEEIPYDFIDQDCDGDDLLDVDRDGFVAEIVGGDDCNDNDDQIHPLAEELDNDIDDNCDGFIDETFADPYDDWPVMIAGSNGELFIEQIALGSDGDLHIGGRFDGKPEFPEGGEELGADGSTEDIFLLRLNEDRDAVWVAGLSTESTAHPHQMIVDSSDSVLVVGSYDEVLDFDIRVPAYVTESNGGTDGFAGLYDSTGYLTWGLSFGGPEDDAAHAVSADGPEAIWIGGSFGHNHDFDPGPADADVRDSPGGELGGYVLKLGHDGSYQNHMVFTGDLKKANTAEVRLLEETDTGLLLVGLFSGTIDMDPTEDGVYPLSHKGEPALFALHMSTEGVLDWVVSLESTGAVEPQRLHLQPDGSFYISGSFEGSMDLDPGKESQSIESAGGIDSFVVVLDASGQYLHSIHIGSSSDDHIDSIAVDSAGDVFVSGSFSDSLTIGDTELTTAGGEDCLVARVSLGEEPSWASSMGTEADEQCPAARLSAAEDRLYVGGWIGTDADFTSLGWDYEHLLLGVQDGWVLHLAVEGP